MAFAGLDVEPVNDCLQHNLANLRVYFAQETAALGVAKTFVPWVVVHCSLTSSWSFFREYWPGVLIGYFTCNAEMDVLMKYVVCNMAFLTGERYGLVGRDHFPVGCLRCLYGRQATWLRFIVN
jgi:hypothetical protein